MGRARWEVNLFGNIEKKSSKKSLKIDSYRNARQRLFAKERQEGKEERPLEEKGRRGKIKESWPQKKMSMRAIPEKAPTRRLGTKAHAKKRREEGESKSKRWYVKGRESALWTCMLTKRGFL